MPRVVTRSRCTVRVARNVLSCAAMLAHVAPATARAPRARRAPAPRTSTSVATAVRPAARMEAYLRGDDQALTGLFRVLAPRLRRFLQTRVDDADMIEDIVQQTFVKAHLGRHAFRARATDGRHSDDAIIAWFLAIARNTAIDGLRSERRHQRGRVHEGDAGESCVDECPSDILDPEQRQIDDETRAALRARVRDAVARLSPSQRDVVTLHKLEGLSMQQVAERLHVMPGAARVRAHRAYLALHALLQPASAASAQAPSAAAVGHHAAAA